MKAVLRVFLGFLMLLSCHSVSLAQSERTNETSASSPLRARLAHGVAEPAVDLNGYSVNPTVRDELVQALDQQMSKAGVPIATDGVPVKVIFIEYKERSEVGRLILGGLGGRDHMTVEVHVGETVFLVSHSGFTSMNTMDAVAQRVGVDAGSRVAKLAGKPVPK